MKKAAITSLLIGFCFIAFSQNSVETINLKGKDYTVTKQIPEAQKVILGRYIYDWGKQKEEPIVELRADGTGLFQPHDVPAIPIKFWIDCDETGNIRKVEGVNGRYQITLLIQYGPGSRIYTEGTYDLMGVTIVTDLNYAVIYGERFKKLN